MEGGTQEERGEGTRQSIEEIVDLIKENKDTLKLLDCSYLHINPEGASRIAEALSHNTHIVNLNLLKNEIGDNGTYFRCCLNILNL